LEDSGKIGKVRFNQGGQDASQTRSLKTRGFLKGSKKNIQKKSIVIQNRREKKNKALNSEKDLKEAETKLRLTKTGGALRAVQSRPISDGPEQKEGTGHRVIILKRKRRVNHQKTYDGKKRLGQYRISVH